MTLEKSMEVLEEVVSSLQRTEQFSHCQVMGVLFAQNLKLWNERKVNEAVRRACVELREFYPTTSTDPEGFDLDKYAVGTLRDQKGQVMFTATSQVSLGSLIQRGVLPSGSNSTKIHTNELFAHSQYFTGLAQGDRTNRNVIKAMVDAVADSGGNGIMLDTSILSKISNICLVDTASEGMIDINRFRIRDGIAQTGILPLEELRFFVDYCHFRQIRANIAGSVESYQAQQLWVLIPEVDQISTRGAASAVEVDPSNPEAAGEDTRQRRVIKRTLVRGIAPPEHGGVLNLPANMLKNSEATGAVAELREMLSEKRRELGLPELEVSFVDSFGRIVAPSQQS